MSDYLKGSILPENYRLLTVVYFSSEKKVSVFLVHFHLRKSHLLSES